MKYIIVLGDGMADEPIQELKNQTPLVSAKTPTMDRLSSAGEIGMVATIPEGMKPGSDVANLSVLGYDPKKYYTGRSPLEALSIGIPMKLDDIAIRCNIVTISEEGVPFEQKTIIDHSASEIETEEAAILLEAVKKELETQDYQFYVGTSYRHCLIWNGGSVVELTAPHDVLEEVIAPHLPADTIMKEMMKKSYEILVNHPINVERKKRGLNPANCCWFWGAGTKPELTPFIEKTGKKGYMVSAVDLLKGMAVGTKMGIAEVEGANGGLHTNYEGKAKAVLNALLEEDYEFSYIHVEAPDEMGHQGSLERKIQAIEYLDGRVIAPIVEGLEKESVPYRMLILPDHPTPVRLRTHTSDPVPYLLYDSTKVMKGGESYCEENAKKTGNYFANGYEVIQLLLENNCN
ncbi:MAG: cofactor-independent phosphoglycerate mutase [Eubacteriales bacterium]